MESYETKIMRDIVKEGMTVVDIGANIGYYSLILSDLVGKKGKVISIEPEPENFRLLLKNINANNKSNINSVKRALSDKDGAIDFFISEEHKGDHRSYDSGDKRKKIKVKSICLDAFLGSKIKPDIIKMDIQGAEYSAIKGMENTLKKKDVILLMEFSPSLIEKSGNSPKELLNLIEKMGFELKFINENKKSISNISKKELLKMCRGNKYTNLYLEKKHIQ